MQKPFCGYLQCATFLKTNPNLQKQSLGIIPSKGAVKSFAKSSRKHLCWNLFLSGDFIKTVTPVVVFSCEFYGIFKEDRTPENVCFWSRISFSKSFVNFKRFLRAAMNKCFWYIFFINNSLFMIYTAHTLTLKGTRTSNWLKKL